MEKNLNTEIILYLTPRLELLLTIRKNHSMDFSQGRMQSKYITIGFHFADITVRINTIGSNSYLYLSFYINLILDKTMNIAPKSSGVISISPAGIVFKVGTSFRIDKALQQKALMRIVFIVGMKKRSRPFVLKNFGESKVVLYKGVIGQTFEIIEIK